MYTNICLYLFSNLIDNNFLTAGHLNSKWLMGFLTNKGAVLTQLRNRSKLSIKHFQNSVKRSISETKLIAELFIFVFVGSLDAPRFQSSPLHQRSSLPARIPFSRENLVLGFAPLKISLSLIFLLRLCFSFM
ncbi:hypothetical protein VNO77_20287 [Canavalia gladiata]|uniref:Uncharacterized protein n=1 Tax=Canavalia gladiata TaxID=3824 RepID=A0AAN9LSH8_CANGL